MEFALQQRRFAASIGRLAASQQQQAESKGARNFLFYENYFFNSIKKLFSSFSAPIAKISFSNPLNNSSSSSFEYQQKQRKPSVFDTFFGMYIKKKIFII